MSRNLGATSCRFCDGEPKLVEPARPVTLQDVPSVYFGEYLGLIVAHAECEDCGAKYLAWLDGTHMRGGFGYPKPQTNPDGTLRVGDLSFRSSFNDEPGPEDMPAWEVIRGIVEKKPWPRCKECGKPMHGLYDGATCVEEYEHKQRRAGS